MDEEGERYVQLDYLGNTMSRDQRIDTQTVFHSNTDTLSLLKALSKHIVVSTICFDKGKISVFVMCETLSVYLLNIVPWTLYFLGKLAAYPVYPCSTIAYRYC